VKYTAPRTIEQTCELLAANPGARVFAGATDVLPQAKAGRALPELLIDLKRIPRLIETTRGDEWVIGAATPAATVTADPEFREDFPGIAEGFALIGSDQIQNRATIGGNLCNASPAADTGPAMVVNDARRGDRLRTPACGPFPVCRAHDRAGAHLARGRRVRRRVPARASWARARRRLPPVDPAHRDGHRGGGGGRDG
jgi:xanthine dehydrogenase iron-sulfur cluster and FAD-binding subunit A